MFAALLDLPRLSPQEVLLRCTVLPVAAASVLGAVRFHRLAPPLRYLVGLLWFVLPLNVASLVLMLQQRNNLFLMPVYAGGEFLGLALVYRQALQSAAFTRVLPWLAGGFAAYTLADSLFGPGITLFRPSQQVLQSILVLGLVGLYFRKLLQELRVQSLAREPMFWVSTGLFVYFVGYLQIALFSNYLLHYSNQLNLNIWAVHSLLFIVLYSCYCLALWLRPQK